MAVKQMIRRAVVSVFRLMTIPERVIDMVRYLQLEEVASQTAVLFGQRLRAARTTKGLSQPMLFESTGVAVTYISQIERGRANPSLDVMLVLAEAVGVPLHEMLRPDEVSELSPQPESGKD